MNSDLVILLFLIDLGLAVLVPLVVLVVAAVVLGGAIGLAESLVYLAAVLTLFVSLRRRRRVSGS